MPTLYIDEDGKTSVYEILEEEVSIGRGAANAVQLRDPRANKHHAVIRRVQGRWKFVDLETKNGTRINGTYRNQHWLQQGDTLSVGKAVLRIDLGAEAAAAAAAAPAIPVAAVAAAVAAPAVPVAPPAAAAPPVAPPAAPARTSPRRAQPASRAPARSAPARSDRRGAVASPRRATRSREEVYDDGDYEDEQPRYRRKDGNAWVKWVIGGAIAIGIVIFIIVGTQGMGSGNRAVYLEAEKIAGPPNIEYERAIKYCERHGDPGAKDYDLIRDAVARWHLHIENTGKRIRDEAARKWLYDNLTRRTRTPGFSAKNAYPEAEIAEKLHGFLKEYAGTFEAEKILAPNPPAEPFRTFHRILRENASKDADVTALLSRAKATADAHASDKRYGDAIAVYEQLETIQRVMIADELYRTLAGESAKRKEALLLRARDDFDRDVREARDKVRSGNIHGARAKLNWMIDTYGVPDMVREAEDELASL